jgi:hypothetical protein
MTNQDDNLIRRIADYERISGILWIVFAIFQIISVVGIIAGVWNIIAGFSRIAIAKDIRARKSTVPAAFEGVLQLVIIGIINLVFGGVIGVVFVCFDFFVRDKVLSNRHLFVEGEPQAFSEPVRETSEQRIARELHEQHEARQNEEQRIVREHESNSYFDRLSSYRTRTA